MHQEGFLLRTSSRWQSLTRAVFLLTCAGILCFALLIFSDEFIGRTDEVSGHIERIERHQVGSRTSVLLAVALDDGRHISFSTDDKPGYHNGAPIVVTEHRGYAGHTTFAVR